MNWYNQPEWWAVIVALLLGLWGVFRDSLLKLFFKPRLDLELLVEKPDCHKTELKFGNDIGGIPGYYYRLRVTNNGNVPAKNIEVFFSKKYSLKNAGELIIDQNFLPLNLKWSHDGVEIRGNIAPTLFKYVDLGFIPHPNATRALVSQFNTTTESSLIMSLDLIVIPNTGSNILHPGSYVFEIWVIADNAKLMKKSFKIQFRDTWIEDEDQMLQTTFTSSPIQS